MNFADLQVFKSVVEEGGVIRAANKLHRVPSAVTTRIKQLEASMGVQLFHRERQRLHLSPAGELLLGYAQRLIQLSDEAREVVSGTTPRGDFKLGSLESTAASRLPAILAEFHGRYPNVRLELTTGTNDWLLRGGVGSMLRSLPRLRAMVRSNTCRYSRNASPLSQVKVMRRSSARGTSEACR